MAEFGLAREREWRENCVHMSLTVYLIVASAVVILMFIESLRRYVRDRLDRIERKLDRDESQSTADLRKIDNEAMSQMFDK